jgi:hypothetical protein
VVGTWVLLGFSTGGIMADEKTSDRCQCEHPNHYPERVGSTDLFPISHTIGERIPGGLHEVETERGPVRVCRFCRDAGHMARS